MRTLRYSKFLRPLLASALLFVTSPAEARITVIDGGRIVTVDGYCAPGTVGEGDCAPQPLPFAITTGGTTYSSFVLNGNGTLTSGDAAIDWNNVSSTLADYPMPIFTPQIDNTIVARINMLDPQGPFDEDTRWAASSKPRRIASPLTGSPAVLRYFVGSIRCRQNFMISKVAA